MNFSFVRFWDCFSAEVVPKTVTNGSGSKMLHESSTIIPGGSLSERFVDMSCAIWRPSCA